MTVSGTRILVEFCGLPGTGKSTLARHVAHRMRAVWLRIDGLEAAMWRNGLRLEQTGIAAYSVAHDVAAVQLRHCLPVVVDAVSPVEVARAGWRELARSQGARHVVIETVCSTTEEHRRRVQERTVDLPGFPLPTWDQVSRTAREYEVRTDDRLVVETTQSIETCLKLISTHCESI
ncbi:AAA family ATPase [Actinopolymorpha pittospori]|uniref:Kinase n=1 Tax=Actinopolymorpha pittospori TaxID=648752 RepID=A0A927RL68_9ACTN|nr:AAA family ATPase [Actinopolymorpha pittospori]MBE1608911.1 putative kinase [Actinopolymorpha pittospori]